VKGFFEEMPPQQRKRFAEVANQADERREQRQKVNKRWEAKHTALPAARGLISWLDKFILLR
jgi:hypothetical protein